jgi:CheY-like chemotaxis protein
LSTALLLTADVAAAERLQSELARIRFRTRCVNSFQAAIDWLAMQPFTTVVIDSRYGREAVLEVLLSGWKHHPLLAGCVFSQISKEVEIWALTAVGAQVFSGPNMMPSMMQFLKRLPEAFAFAERSHFGVLVVEDLDSPREIISAYVESLGFSAVDQAKSAEDALKLIEKDPYRYFAMLTDLQMPGQSGIELIRRIRCHQDELISALPVVVLTSVPTPENLYASIKEGATGFLVKPPKKKQLRQELEKAKRIAVLRQSPRLCEAALVEKLEGNLEKLLGGKL